MDFKMKNPGRAGLPKECFPKLLNSLLEQMKDNVTKCLESGFRKSGMYPLDRKEVYKSLPGNVHATSTEHPLSILDKPSSSYLPAINIPRSNQEANPCPSCSHSSSPVLSNKSSFSNMESSVVDLLQKMCSNSEKKKRKQKKTKLVIKPGKSVTVLDEELVDDVLGIQDLLPDNDLPTCTDNGQPSSVQIDFKVLENKRQNRVNIGAQKKKVKRKLKKEFSSDESISFESQSESDNDNIEKEVLHNIETEKRDEEELQNIVEGNMKPGVWVLIEGKGKSVKKHWVGQVISIDEAGDPMIKLKKKKQEKYKGNKPYFTWCYSEGSVVDQGCVVKVLPEPNFTPRGWLLFPVSFGPEYNVL